MYKIMCDGSTLYDPRNEETAIIDGKCSLAVNKTGEFTFSIPPMHPATKTIRKVTSVIELYDGEQLLFAGRVLYQEVGMYGETTYTCEGELGYLLDSVQRPKEYHDLTPKSYLQDKIVQHNSHVGKEKQFQLGTVELNSMNYDARADNQYTNTLDTIQDKLISSNGGYLRVRHDNDKRCLDYLKSYGRTSLQTIHFDETIIDLSERISAENITTVLIPLGKAPDGATDGAKLTIAAVNGGRDYLENKEAIDLFGRIEGTNEWSDVTLAANLKTKGEEWLKSAANTTYTITLTAIDLHLLDAEIDRIMLGDSVRVVSDIHGIDRYMTVTQRTYDLTNPDKDTITLGDTISALTEQQAQMQKNMEKQNDISNKVDTLETSVTRVATEIESAKKEVKSLGEQVKNIEESGTGTNEKISDLEKKIDVHTSKCDLSMQDMLGKIQVLESRIQALESGV